MTSEQIVRNSSIKAKKEALLLDQVGRFKDAQNMKHQDYLNSLKKSEIIAWKTIDEKDDFEIEKLHEQLIIKLKTR